MTYLKRLPLSELKVDRSFVSDVLTDPRAAAIARSIVGMAQSLGLSVAVEGIEVEAQRQFFADLGCDTYQGYLFSKPLPVAEMEDACGFDFADESPADRRSTTMFAKGH